MIPNNIKDFDTLEPYLISLGLEKKASHKDFKHYRLDNDKLDVNIIYNSKAKNENDEIFLANFFDDDKNEYGYYDIIKYLNEKFKYVFRKKYLKKLLNDK